MTNCLHTRQYGLSILFPLFILLNYCQLHAQTKTWDGGAGTNKWMDAANWNDDQLPQPTNDVLLMAADVELDGMNDVDVQKIDMCCAATLTIGADASLTGDYVGMQHAGTSITNHGTLTANGSYNFGISLGGYSELTNYGTLNTYNTGPDGGIKLFGATATNNGTVFINGSTGNGDGIHLINFSGVVSTFTNYGLVTITNTMGDGISGGGVYHNHGTTDITNVTYWNDLLLDGEDGLAFENYSGALFRGDGQVDPTTFNWNGGEMTSDDANNSIGIVEFYCLGNCNGENFTDANLVFNIDGTAGPGVAEGHDQVQVNKNAELGGNIEVILGSGFIPEIGDAFTIITYATKTGGDPIFDFPILPADRQWNYSVGLEEVEISVSALLPVEMISFKAENMEDYIELNWSTGSEINNRGFFVEKSSDGLNWEYLGFVEGNGNRHSISNYVYEDYSPHKGKNYYRLIQSDYDGRQEKSNTVSVNFKSGNLEEEVNLYPNPIKKGNYLNVSFFGNDIDFDKISIYNQAGLLIYYQEKINEDIQINTSDFARGTHTMMIESGGVMVQKRFMVFE